MTRPFPTHIGAPQTVPRREDTWMTVEEVASKLRVSKMTVCRMVNSGELYAIRIGRNVRVSQRALHEFELGAVIEP